MKAMLYGVAFAALLASGSPASCADTLASRIDGLPIPWNDSLDKSLHTPIPGTQGDAKPARLHYAAMDDADTIRRWLRSEGYLDAAVSADIKQGKAVRWRVAAGVRWQIGELSVEPAAPASVKLPEPGAWFRTAEYEAAKIALRGAWTDAGFLRAGFAESAVFPDHQRKRVRIVWHINPGQQYRIGRIEVLSARQYSPELATRLSLLGEGDVPDSGRIRAAIRNISNDSHYRSASVIPLLPEGTTTDRVPMRIEVVEADRYTLSGTAGYSTDSGPEAGAAWVDRGIAGGMFEYGLQGSVSRTNSTAGMSFSRPVWPGLQDKSGLSLNFLREDTAGQRFDTVSGGPFWLHQFDERQNVRAEVKQSWITGSGERIRTLGPGFTVHLDTRIGEGIPIHGWKGNLNVGLPYQTNGSGRWFITRMDLRAFYGMGRGAMLSPRLGYGRSVSLKGAVPKSLRQYGGGAGSVRGYKLDSLGPVGADALSQGGLQSANAGVDLLYNANERFSPVLFADTGQVWSAPQSREKAVWSLGLGVIAGTPAGPVRADIAFPQVRRAQDASFQLYIAFGEVF